MTSLARVNAPAAILLLLATSALAQIHPLPPREQTLAERIDLARIVVLGRVGRIERGRIVVDAARSILGDEVASGFEVKRAPGRAPPFAAGDWTVLFLDGARPPYILVDDPKDAVHFASEREAGRFAEAVRQLVAARDDRSALLALHLDWLGDPIEPLRRLALVELQHLASPLRPYPADFGVERAALATDAGRSVEERQASARLAILDPRGLCDVLEWLPGPADDPASAPLAQLALVAGASRRAPALEPALLRSLRDERAEVRVAAARSGALLRTAGPELRSELEDRARSDPDDQVRRRAARALRRLQAVNATPGD